MSFLSRMKLVYQISLISIVALVIFAVVGTTQFVADQQRQSAQEIAKAATADQLVVDGISREFLNARRHEKDFVLRKSEEYITSHSEAAASVRSGLEELAGRKEIGELIGQVDQARAAFEDYVSEFANVVELQRKVGLDASSGLLGEMREAASEVETALGKIAQLEAMLGLSNTKDISIAVLKMRRDEKDFLATLDPVYVSNVDATAKEFDAALQKAGSIQDEKKGRTGQADDILYRGLQGAGRCRSCPRGIACAT
ncbi:hypothetical protein [Thalassospira povalilytica]|uniref:hypothetical protein n=1 Tax=Thalassospira povalilytica TaxID=732237 RepID=UPI003AA903B0